jgi:ABC-2 type transport system permease protein
MPAPRLRAVLHVARNDVRLMLRDRGTIFWSFVGPILFMMFFGFLFKDTPDRPTRVEVRNEDRSPAFATAMELLLRDDGLDVKVASPDSALGTGYSLVVVAGAADSLAAGRPPRLVLHTPNDDPTPREQALKAQIARAMMSAFLGLEANDAYQSLDSTAVRERISFAPRIRLDKHEIHIASSSTGFQHTVPAYLVMFLFMTLMTAGAEILIAERRSGQLRRTLVSSVRQSEVMLGKCLSRFGFAWLQIAVILAAGIVFRIRFGAHPEALFVMLVVLALAATGMGLLYATCFRNPDKAGGIGSLIVMGMAALGGCWWPLEIVPGWMRKIAFALPTGWGYDALNRIMALDAGLPQLGRHLAVFIGIAAITLPLAARRMPRER